MEIKICYKKFLAQKRKKKETKDRGKFCTSAVAATYLAILALLDF